MEDKYLPIGTIVFLKDDIVMHMIVGYLSKDKEGKLYDYLSIPFPYGMMTTNAVLPFNHKDIEEIIFNGYKNEKFDEIKKYLDEYLIKEKRGN